MKQGTTVIEFGSSKVICVIAEKTTYSDNNVLGMGVGEYKCVGKGAVVDSDDMFEALTEAVKDADAQAGRRIRSAFISVPAEYSVIKRRKCHVDFGKDKIVTERDVEMLFKTGEEGLSVPGYKIIHRSPVSFKVDDITTMNPIGVSAKVLEARVSYIFADLSYIRETTSMLDKLGIGIRDYISAPLGQTLMFVPPAERDKASVIFDIGYDVASVIAVKGDAIAYMKSFGMGGRNISRDISKVIDIPYDLAEQLKRRCVFGLNISEDDSYEAVDKNTMKLVRFPAVQVHQVVEARINEILDRLFDSLGESKINFDDNVILHLTGGGLSFMRGIRDYITRNYGVETEIIEPKGTRLNKPSHSAIAGVLDMVISDEDEVEENGILAKIKNIIKF